LKAQRNKMRFAEASKVESAPRHHYVVAILKVRARVVPDLNVLRNASVFNPWQLLGALLLAGCSGEATGLGDTDTAPSASGSSASAGVAGTAGGGVSNGESGGTEAADVTSAGTATGGTTAMGGTTATGGSAQAGTGGSGSLGGATENGGSAGTGGQPVPKGPIDFSYWALQLPTGSGTSPTQISSADLLAGFKNEYFYMAADGGQAYMDPPQGITTSGSTRCRTEMREQNPTGGAAAWPSTGTHTMTVEGAVTKMSGGSVTVGQLFNDSGSIPLMELQYSSGHNFSVFYEESKGGGNSTDLKTNVPLGTHYTFALAMVDGKASITINGKQVYTKTPSAGILAGKFYFKFGNYDQATSAGTPSTTVHSIVEAYKVDVAHQ
jgi:hypothetical protein